MTPKLCCACALIFLINSICVGQTITTASSSGRSSKSTPTATDPAKKEDAAKKDEVSKPWEKFKKPAVAVLQKKLTRIQFRVTQSSDTEPAYKNEYFNNHDEGIYVDILSGEPLFSSVDKYDSGTGWPSFVRPLEPDYIVTRPDTSENMIRIEVRSKYANSHLGHVFNDGPPVRGGLRFCMNSASLRFIPKAK